MAGVLESWSFRGAGFKILEFLGRGFLSPGVLVAGVIKSWSLKARGFKVLEF